MRSSIYETIRTQKEPPEFRTPQLHWLTHVVVMSSSLCYTYIIQEDTAILERFPNQAKVLTGKDAPLPAYYRSMIVLTVANFPILYLLELLKISIL